MYDCNIFNILKDVFTSEEPNDEQKHALNCLWNLVFDEKIRENAKKDRDLMQSLKNLYEFTPSDDLRKTCAGITHTINEFPKKILESKSSTNKRNLSTKNHVMISYNSSARDLCVKIKDKLKSDGFKVWMDIEQIQGSALQSMAEAVENSAVILICITERYYLSPNCRLEAEYAVRLNKPIVPLLMQSKFIPQGWLGIAIGSKIYYDFSKYTIEEKYPSFLREIQSFYTFNDDSTGSQYGSNNSSPQKTPSKVSSLSDSNSKVASLKQPLSLPIKKPVTDTLLEKSTKKQEIKAWACSDVEKWLQKLNLKT